MTDWDITRLQRLVRIHGRELSAHEDVLQSHDRTIVGLILTSCVALGLSIVANIVLLAVVMG